MNRENDRRTAPNATREAALAPDTLALEEAAESLVRFGDLKNAVALWAHILWLRAEQ